MEYKGFSAIDAGTGYTLHKQAEQYALYRRADERTVSEIALCRLMPGVELVLRDTVGTCGTPATVPNGDILQIDHCLEGRAEYNMEDGCVTYLGEGDVFFSMRDNYTGAIHQPLGYFKGLSLLVFINLAQPALAKAMPEYPLDLNALRQKFLMVDDCFTIHARKETSSILDGIYEALPKACLAWARLAALQLLLYLSFFNTACEQHYGTYALQHTQIAKRAHKMLTEDLSRRYTIEELAGALMVSPSALKTYFRGVYGKPVAAYLKELRMQKAADLLRHTDKSVAEVAAAVGYTSQSKFSEVFRKQMGTTPSMWRQRAMP